jgi:hypothetical protein
MPGNKHKLLIDMCYNSSGQCSHIVKKCTFLFDDPEAFDGDGFLLLSCSSFESSYSPE